MLASMAADLASPNGLATGLWVRTVAAKAAGGQGIVIGTVGLSAFGHPEIEYSPRSDLAGGTSHALATSWYLLSSGALLDDGQTIGVEGQERYDLRRKACGTFTPDPVITLEAR